jgi:hypothetical protein
MELRLLWELDLRRKRGHLAPGSGWLSAGVRDVFAAFCRLVVGVERGRIGRAEYSRLGRLHILAADLKVEAVGILNVKTVFGVGLGIKGATIQLRLYRILVPILNRISDMIDPRRRTALRRVAGNHKRVGVAEDQVALLAGIGDDFHSQQIRVEVAGLRVVVDLVGNVIDRDDLEAFGVLCRSGPWNGGGCCDRSDALDQLASRHSATFKIVQ